MTITTVPTILPSPLVLASTAQRIGVAIAVAMAVAWLVYVVVTTRQRDPETPIGSEIELAPNRRPYFDDEVLEGSRLDRYLGWALVLMIISAVGPLVYWLNEPSRQAGAVEEFDRKAVERGRVLFLPTESEEHGLHFGCAGCHGGMKAEGGEADYALTLPDGSIRRVKWDAPRLDNVMARFSEDEVENILIYGRANTPMPAWGVEGGGPMNAQQITDLVAYIKSIQVPSARVREISDEAIASEARSSGLSTDSGETLFRAMCARCHTKGWSYGEPDVQGGGAFGPNLTNGDVLRQFPDREQLVEFITEGTEYGKPYGERGMGGNEGGGMPGFGRMLTEDQIAAIVDYVRGL